MAALRPCHARTHASTHAYSLATHDLRLTRFMAGKRPRHARTHARKHNYTRTLFTRLLSCIHPLACQCHAYRSLTTAPRSLNTPVLRPSSVLERRDDVHAAFSIAFRTKTMLVGTPAQKCAFTFSAVLLGMAKKMGCVYARMLCIRVGASGLWCDSSGGWWSMLAVGRI